MADLTGGILHGPSDFHVIDLSASTADFNSDGDVDGDDFLTWRDNAGLLTGATLEQGDSNGDGAVNQVDLLAWQNTYGQIANGTVVTVTEPTALVCVWEALLLFGMNRLNSPSLRQKS